MSKKTKKILITVFFMFFFIVWLNRFSVAQQESLEDRYYAVPPFLQSGDIKPNVLLIVDNSGSMKRRAYWPEHLGYSKVDDTYNPDNTYYGYFNPKLKYSYDKKNNYFYGNGKGKWSGNFLNWLTMRRIDIALKVLVGGNYKEDGENKYLQGFNDTNSNYYKYIFRKKCPDSQCRSQLPSEYLNREIWVGIDKDLDKDSKNDRFYFTVCSKVKESEEKLNKPCLSDEKYVYKYDKKEKKYYYCCYKNENVFAIRLKVNNEPRGILDNFYKKVRLGLMVFNYKGDKYETNRKNSKDGGYLVSPIKDLDNETLAWKFFNFFRNQDECNEKYPCKNDKYPPLYPINFTPLAETLYEATRYFRGEQSAYSSEDYSSNDPIQFRCQRNFVILITDGGSTQDFNLPGSIFSNYKGKISPIKDSMDFNATKETVAAIGKEGKMLFDEDYNGTYYLVGVSYWAHTHDLRPELKGFQNLDIYTIFAFEKREKSKELLNNAAKYGGFTDLNGNGKPDLPQEWDKNGDGYADNFFVAYNGQKLEDALNKALSDILKKSSSGTSIGIPSQKRSASSSAISHSVVLQALFYPKKIFEGKYQVNWIGYLYSWWLYNTSSIQNIREDTNENRSLDVLEDRILRWELDDNGQLTIEAYKSRGDGKIDNSTLPDVYNSFDETQPIWEAGKELSLESPDERRIYTTDGSSLINFSTEYVDRFKAFLGTDESSFPDCLIKDDGSIDYQKLIEYVRGTDFPGCRSRIVDEDNDTWKLGDVIYSTPWVEKYGNYTVAFVGANDGMLHAFRVGYLEKTTNPTSPITIQNSKFDNGKELLGKELWAFIPKNALPYLRFLADPNYKHMYFIDLKPYVVNTDDGKKILIGGMRLGGGTIYEDEVQRKICDDESKKYKYKDYYVLPPSDVCPDPCNPQNCVGLSSYFALDVTDPLNPKFLWEFTNNNLGFSFSGPGIIKRPEGTYVIFGEGPDNYKGVAAHSNPVLDDKLYFFVLDLQTGKLKRIIVLDKGRSFSGRIFKEGVDIDGDGYTDYIFIGYSRADKEGNNWSGGIVSIKTQGSSPKNWKVTTYLDGDINPITSKVLVTRCFGTYYDAHSLTYDNKKIFYMYFGTGKWLFKNDEDSKMEVNSLYGLPIKCDKDRNCDIVTDNTKTDWNEVCEDISQYPHTLAGWKVDLDPAEEEYLKERNISDPTFVENIVFFTTTQPTKDICGFGGRSRMWALNCATGGTIHSACPGFSVSLPRGKLYLQLSGANIVVINPKVDFGNSTSSKQVTEWYQGITPETGSPFVGYSKSLQGKLLFWVER